MEGRNAVKRLALARFLSGTGSRLALIALAFLIFQKTGSSLWVAAVFFFNFGVIPGLAPTERSRRSSPSRMRRGRSAVTAAGAPAGSWEGVGLVPRGRDRPRVR
jgi:hypothetical protein